MKNMQELIDFMVLSGVLKSSEIIEAFGQIDRKYFVPKEFGKQIYVDAPLPIGKNQTISQPSTVAFMLELLKSKKGDKILDIGSGSGWTTSLLCQLVGSQGSVIGLERVSELVDIGEKNLAQFNFGEHCCIKKAGDKLGIPKGLFDKILVSASAKETPKELFSQLKPKGVLVIPIKNSIFRFEKLSESKFLTQEFAGFVFVPLIS